MKKKTLVFGASLKPQRYSNVAIHRLRAHKQPAVAFGLRSGEVIGVRIDTELKPYKDIDTVTLYMNPERQKPFYDYLISLNPKRVIFNPGTENFELVKLLKEHQIKADFACTLVLLATNQY